MNLLEQATRNPDVDEAIAPIMQALGITEGDCAGQIFSSHVDRWNLCKPRMRAELLAQWLAAEARSCGFDKTVPTPQQQKEKAA